MMRTSGYALAVLLGLGAAAGCASFEAVTAASKVGTKLGDYAPQTRVSLDNCRQLRALLPEATCPKETERWSRALEMLVAYSNELGRIANPKGPSVQDSVNKVLDQGASHHWLPLTGDENKAISQFAQVVSTLLLREMTREAMQKAIREAGPQMDEVVRLLSDYFKEEQKQLGFLRHEIACRAGSPLDGRPCAASPLKPGNASSQALALWYAQLSLELDAQDSQLAVAQRAVEAFGKAHHELYVHVEHLDDKEVLKAVMEDLGAVMTAPSATTGSKDGGSDG